ncbi:SCP2 sterol-binding domain-containing protein [Zobellella sp. DQSA1]|uniref:SCP2 sterol-binding domain-containing protein n=1 Tax=Zobellella sp. DQSA1 TaxID=3342386 RepID=UPI0035BFF6A5
MSDKRLNSIDEVIASMRERFNPKACENVKANYQWKISGDTGRDFCVAIDKGSFDIVEGEVNDPNVVFQTDVDTYLRLVNQEIKGMTAILTRKLQVRGNIYLAGKMDQIFK